MTRRHSCGMDLDLIMLRHTNRWLRAWMVTAFALCCLTPLLAASQEAAQTQAPSELRIGYQKSSTLITVLRAQGTLEAALKPLHVTLTWHEFPSGLPLTEALNEGAIDFSADVADTVPIFAQAAHAQFIYLAQEAPSPQAQGILVHPDGPIHDLADLRGKKIAVTRAAGSHYLLLAALAQAHLKLDQVQVAYLAPADGRAAFEGGNVDAWITWDPYLTAIERQTKVRVLTGGAGLGSYQRYYLASASYAARRPDVLKILFDQLSAAGDWTRAHPQQAAQLLAPLWGLDQATTAAANAHRSYQVRLIDKSNFAEQQKIADLFYAAGVLPARVDTAQAQIWH
jgi:sulfonate transport system substrate-binding protein